VPMGQPMGYSWVMGYIRGISKAKIEGISAHKAPLARRSDIRNGIPRRIHSSRFDGVSIASAREGSTLERESNPVRQRWLLDAQSLIPSLIHLYLSIYIN